MNSGKTGDAGISVGKNDSAAATPRRRSSWQAASLSLQAAVVSGGDTMTHTPAAAKRARALANSVSSSSIVGITTPTRSPTAMARISSRYVGSVHTGTWYAPSLVHTAGDNGFTSVTRTRPPPARANAVRNALTSGTRRDAAVMSTLCDVTAQSCLEVRLAEQRSRFHVSREPAPDHVIRLGGSVPGRRPECHEVAGFDEMPG